jgi:hypothetical protein
MKARVRKAELESFKDHAAQIRKNNELPILEYLKIEVIGDFVHITKTNMKAFVIQTTVNDSEDCSFLVDENVLFNFIQLSDSEYINFEISGIRIKIYDDRHNAISQTDNVKTYPSVDITNKEWVSVPKHVLDAVGVCAQIVFDDEISGLRNSVFIGDNYVAASDATVGYWQKHAEDLPKLVLRKEVAMAVSKLNGCEISSNESYDLFKSGNSLFGFSKSEIKYVNLPPLFLLPEEKLSFYLNKSALVKWNTCCVNSCKSKVLTATFSAKSYRLELELIDAKYSRDYNSYLDIIDGEGFFKFNPLTLNTLLKVLPTEQIHFYPSKRIVNGCVDRYYITDKDKTFMSAIMLIN